MSEAGLHAAVVQYLSVALPRDAVLHHSPNEGKRGWRAQRSLKVMGVRAGWPDLEIIHGGKIFFIELKTAKGRCTSSQSETLAHLSAAGAHVAVCHSIEAVEAFLKRHMPLRGALVHS